MEIGPPPLHPRQALYFSQGVYQACFIDLQVKENPLNGVFPFFFAFSNSSRVLGNSTRTLEQVLLLHPLMIANINAFFRGINFTLRIRLAKDGVN